MPEHLPIMTCFRCEGIVVLGFLKPLLRTLPGIIVYPVTSTFAGRINDTGNMPAAPQGKSHRTTDKLCDTPGRLPGNNMVLLRTNCVDILTNLAEINRYTFQDNLVWLDEVVLKISIAQVKRVCCRGHACAIVIPIEQVKGRWLL